MQYRIFRLPSWFGCALLFLSLPAAAQPQSMEAVQVEGITLNLIVPEGHCKLPRQGHGKAMYDLIDRAQKDFNLTLLITAACKDVRDMMESGGGLPDFSMYSVPIMDGKAMRIPSGMNRASVAQGLAKASTQIKPEDMQAESRARLAAAGIVNSADEKRVSGKLDVDAYGYYLGLAKTVASSNTGGRPVRVWSVTLMSEANGLFLHNVRSGQPTTGAPFQQLLGQQKSLAEALAKANRE